jgi:ketol-acid reductoisomerase
MKQVLKEIQDGTFARNWIDENRQGRPNFQRLREEERNHQLERVGAELRRMMVWLDGKKKDPVRS